VPPRVALELLLTGDPIDAARACEVGLVNRVVAGDRLHESVQQLAESIAANAPLSVRAAKEMVYRAAVGRSDDDVAIADAIWEPVYRSEDAQEGPRAFGERRPPEWKGR
jgi:enoyl-CoA hydratase/carnithine racemase